MNCIYNIIKNCVHCGYNITPGISAWNNCNGYYHFMCAYQVQCDKLEQCQTPKSCEVCESNEYNKHNDNMCTICYKYIDMKTYYSEKFKEGICYKLKCEWIYHPLDDECYSICYRCAENVDNNRLKKTEK